MNPDTCQHKFCMHLRQLKAVQEQHNTAHTEVCTHVFCTHLRNTAKKLRDVELRRTQLEVKNRVATEALKRSHYLEGTERKFYYKRNYCLCTIRNTLFKNHAQGYK